MTATRSLHVEPAAHRITTACRLIADGARLVKAIFNGCGSLGLARG
jgi:hypothetical protein